MDITWLNSFAQAWCDRLEHGRMPHAVLLTGATGVGKRAAAAWIAAQRLGIGEPVELPQYPVTVPEHADLHWIRPADDKEAIGIEQIRDLVAKFSLTSYTGGSKIAVIEPANAMTINAANSLLKTLEDVLGRPDGSSPLLTDLPQALGNASPASPHPRFPQPLPRPPCFLF